MNVALFEQEWDIKIVPLEGTNTAFFGHRETTSGTRINPNMPSGFTGKREMILWLNDTKNEFIDRSNHVVLMHEFCHAAIYDRHATNKFNYFVDHVEYQGHWVKSVHEKIDYQGRILESFLISFWYWKFPIWRNVRLNVIDVRQELSLLS